MNNPSRYTDPTGHWVVETNKPEQEKRRDAYIHAAERLKKKDQPSKHLKEYYIYAAAYYHAVATEAPQEIIDIGDSFLEAKADNVRRNGWNGVIDAKSAAGDVTLSNAPEMLGPATIGLAGMIMWKGNPIEVDGHALKRINERGLTIDEVEWIMNNKDSFFYEEKGVLTQGWYDKGKKVLVAMAVDDQYLTTVMTDVSPQYIAGLRNRKP